MNADYRCLFCKNDSSSSLSAEHIVPESLGNKKFTLSPGIVCDRCNNYFARKVERPFLESSAVLGLRFYQMLKNKRGRVPPVEAVIFPDIRALVTRDARDESTSIEVSPESLELIRNRKAGTLVFPASWEMPNGAVVSRFIAKIALEAMAARLDGTPGGLRYLCEEPQLDELRNHARNGTTPIWPVHMRYLYPVNGAVRGDNGDLEQILHEYDFLLTPWSEWFFVIAIFGIEFCINLGGPEIDGYLQWLSQNGDASPLYIAKNGDVESMPR